MKRLFLVIAGMLCSVGLCAAWYAPYLDGELLGWLQPHAIFDPSPVKLTKGEMVDEYFAVQDLGARTFAIGEPRYYQQNYSYLIIGDARAILFDSGSGTRDLSSVIKRLTRLPVTVIVSHLHYDHLGGIGAFEHIAMIDLPETRADVSGSTFRAGRYEYMGMIDHLEAPFIRVEEWLKPGAMIDLGNRSLEVLATPGHTASSIALLDLESRRLFIGDFMYPTTLYAFLPGASLSAYQETAEKLLMTLPADTVLWTAHCCRDNEGIAAPWLTMKDVRDLDAALRAVRSGQAKPKGFYPRVYPVNDQMTLATGFSWNNR